jgi:hypothetical protein
LDEQLHLQNLRRKIHSLLTLLQQDDKLEDVYKLFHELVFNQSEVIQDRPITKVISLQPDNTSLMNSHVLKLEQLKSQIQKIQNSSEEILVQKKKITDILRQYCSPSKDLKASLGIGVPIIDPITVCIYLVGQFLLGLQIYPMLKREAKSGLQTNDPISIGGRRGIQSAYVPVVGSSSQSAPTVNPTLVSGGGNVDF